MWSSNTGQCRDPADGNLACIDRDCKGKAFHRRDDIGNHINRQVGLISLQNCNLVSATVQNIPLASNTSYTEHFSLTIIFVTSEHTVEHGLKKIAPQCIH